MSSIFKSLRSTELENTGSTARDHCANERTLLAWVRTSLTLVSFGIAIAQFFQLPSATPGSPGASPESLFWFKRDHAATPRNFAKPLGSAFVLLGILTLLFGAKRYFQVQEQLIRGRFETSRSEAFIIVVLVTALLVAVLSVIVAT